MKRKIIYLFILTALFYSCSLVKAQESKLKKTDLQKQDLKENVKSIREISYKAVDKFGELQKGEREKSSYIIFNDKGNEIEENKYKLDGSLDYKYTYEYDDKGNIIEFNSYKSDGSLSSKLTWEYDDKGNKIEENSYKSDGSLNYKWTYKYDDKGNKIEQNEYKSDGSLNYKYTYKYDDKGNNIERNEYKSDGSLDNKYTYKYEYDNFDNWLKRIDYVNDIPQYIIEREIEYIVPASSQMKQKNDWAEMNLYGKVKSLREISYEAIEKSGEVQKGDKKRSPHTYDFYILFNDKGNEIEKNLYNSDGSLDFKNTYKYDDKGNIIEENSYNPDGGLKYKIKYDDKGNEIGEYGTIFNYYMYTCKYDDKGNIIERNKYYSYSRSLDYKLKYDDKGNIIERNQMGLKYIYKYDDKENIIECNTYISGDSLHSKDTYKYDDKKNVIENNWYLEDGRLGSKYTYKYEYDTYGNWTKRIKYKDEYPIYIIEREIEYY